MAKKKRVTVEIEEHVHKALTRIVEDLDGVNVSTVIRTAIEKTAYHRYMDARDECASLKAMMKKGDYAKSHKKVFEKMIKDHELEMEIFRPIIEKKYNLDAKRED